MFQPAKSDAADPGRFAGLIDAIGTADFVPRLLGFGRAQAGADYVSLYCLEARHLRGVGVAGVGDGDIARRMATRFVAEDYWRRDPAVAEAMRRCAPRRPPISVRMFPQSLPDREFSAAIWGPTDVVDRLAVWSARGEAIYGAAFLRRRSHGYYSAAEVERITRLADELVASLATHDRIARSAAVGATPPLDDPAGISACLLARAPALTRREREVASRLIAGQSAPAIAALLGLGAETVATYRKRAYARLGVADRRALLRWYVEGARAAH